MTLLLPKTPELRHIHTHTKSYISLVAAGEMLFLTLLVLLTAFKHVLSIPMQFTVAESL